MAQLNQVSLIGYLGADPELRTTATGKLVAKLSLATTRKITRQDGSSVEDTSWHRIIAWERVADFAQSYLRKGSQVFVQGRLQYRKWDQGGERKFSTEIVAMTLLGLDRKPDGAGGDATANASTQRSHYVPKAEPQQDEDIPF